MKKTALILSFCITGGAQAQTHCSSSEMTIFNCEVGKKILSVCASADLDDTKGWMQYRFGAPDKIDLTYPETKAHPKKFFQSNRTYSSVENALIQELKFQNGKVAYTVYREEIKGKKEAGVSVNINAKETYLKCKNLKGTENFISKIDELRLDGIN